MLGQLLNRPATPSKVMDELYRQESEMANLLQDVAKLQAKMDANKEKLRQYGIQYTSPTAPHTTQGAGLLRNTQTTTYPTQVVSGVHTRNTETTMAPTATVQPTNVTAEASIVDKLAPETRTKQTTVVPSTQHSRLRPKSQPATPSNGTVASVIDILANRAPYHTTDIQISNINECGQVLMHEHYLAGDGINAGIPTPEGYDVRLVTSKAGKTYRLMSVPALKITCSLTKPLPEDLVSRKRMLREWLAANDYLRGTDASKAQFYTEYDAWGEEYTPYVSLDGKNTALYIYIGCESLNSAKPCPTLIA